MEMCYGCKEAEMLVVGEIVIMLLFTVFKSVSKVTVVVIESQSPR